MVAGSRPISSQRWWMIGSQARTLSTDGPSRLSSSANFAASR
jgi:hypothetical protein